MSSLAKKQKKANSICSGIIGEMDEAQLDVLIPFLNSVSFSDAAETESEDEEEDEKPVKGKAGKKSSKKDDEEEEEEAEEEEDEEEEEKPTKGKNKSNKKPAKKDDDDEEEEEADDEDEVEEAEEEEDEEEEEKPAKGKTGKKSAKKDDDDEEESEEAEEEVDYSSMKLPALKKLSDEHGLPTKTLIKGKDDKKAAKAIIAALEAYDANKAAFGKMKLDKLLKLVEKHEVEYAKPRGKAGDDKKKDAAIAALLAAGVEA